MRKILKTLFVIASFAIAIMVIMYWVGQVQLAGGWEVFMDRLRVVLEAT